MEVATLGFLALQLGISVCAFLVGWSAASIYQIAKHQKQWKAMQLRAEALEAEADRLVRNNLDTLRRIDNFENKYKPENQEWKL